MRTLLNECAKVEMTIAEIYRVLAATPGFRPEVQAIYLELAHDEEDHASQLGHALEVPPEKIMSSSHIIPSSDRATRLLERARAILAQLRETPLGENESLRIAAELEKDFRQMHLFALARFTDERLKTLFSRFARAEEQHLQLLERLLAAPHKG